MLRSIFCDQSLLHFMDSPVHLSPPDDRPEHLAPVPIDPDNMVLSPEQAEHPGAEQVPTIRMLEPAYERVMDYLGEWQGYEKAGLLLGPRESDLVTHFVPDESGIRRPASFTLDASYLNAVLARWKNADSDAKGIVHVHPPGISQPSSPDLKYVQRSFRNPKNQQAKLFLLPIVCSARFYPYIVLRDQPQAARPADLVLI